MLKILHKNIKHFFLINILLKFENMLVPGILTKTIHDRSHKIIDCNFLGQTKYVYVPNILLQI